MATAGDISWSVQEDPACLRQLISMAAPSATDGGAVEEDPSMAGANAPVGRNPRQGPDNGESLIGHALTAVSVSIHTKL